MIIEIGKTFYVIDLQNSETFSRLSVPTSIRISCLSCLCLYIKDPDAVAQGQ